MPPKKATIQATGNSALMTTMQEIRANHNLKADVKGEYEDGCPDIVTFCNSPDFLNLPANNFKLWPTQILVMKCLYMGSRGNRHVRLSTEEWEWLYSNVEIHDTAKIIEKLKERERHITDDKFRFSELTMILGRRSSKTVIASIVSSYEAYKLLCVGNGDPYKFYDIPYDQEIAILNVANSGPQAHRLFSQVKARLRGSKCFQGRIDSVSASTIKLFTDYDLKRKRDGGGSLKIEGTVHLVSGHSNPATLVGYTNMCVVFDELGYYDEGAKAAGRDFYEALTPPVAQFAPFGDGIIVEISTPGPKNGILYKIWKEGFDEPNMLSFRFPTWIFNPKMDEEGNTEMTKARNRDKAMFDVQWGAEWPESGMYGFYFPEDVINKVLEESSKRGIFPDDIPVRGREYYLHFDPALSGANYAVVIVSKTMYRDSQGQLQPRVSLAKVVVWSPEPNKGLDSVKIEDEILHICKQYRPVKITCDQMGSQTFLSILRRHGFDVEVNSYNRSFKNQIYQQLRELMLKPELGIHLWDHPLLTMELRYLKYSPLPGGRGCRIGADVRSECPTDDVCDCLSGATWAACKTFHKALPMSGVVYTGYR